MLSGAFLCEPSTIFRQHARMPDGDIRLALRTADQTCTDFAMIEDGLEFLMQRVDSLPTASDLWRVAVLIAFAAAMLGIVGIEALATCGST